jgi:ABC-type transport system involved in multi-copper enzyme maturation permease subunit
MQLGQILSQVVKNVGISIAEALGIFILAILVVAGVIFVVAVIVAGVQPRYNRSDSS